jgi:hypothetical protein
MLAIVDVSLLRTPGIPALIVPRRSFGYSGSAQRRIRSSTEQSSTRAWLLRVPPLMEAKATSTPTRLPLLRLWVDMKIRIRGERRILQPEQGWTDIIRRLCKVHR